MKICLNCNFSFDAAVWKCPKCDFEPARHDGFLSLLPAQQNRKQGFKAEFFSQLDRYEIGNFWFENRNHLIVHVLKKYFYHAQSLLEIGSGNGFVLGAVKSAVPHLTVYGSDLFIDALEIAFKKNPGIDFFQMNSESIPMDEEVDLITALDVLEHIQRDGVVLAEMFRAVKKGGGIILTVPQHPFMWSYNDIVSCHVRRYTRKELKKKVEVAGFKIVKITSFVAFLFPLMIISRFLQKGDSKEYDPMLEFKIPKIVNRWFRTVLSLEQKLLHRDMTLPFGGSLLLVAKKPKKPKSIL